MNKTISIIGAGNGGQAFGAYLSLHGFDIKIFDVVQHTVDVLNEKGGISIEGNADVSGFGKILMASTDIGEVMEGTDIVLIVLPSLYHADMARKMAPYLKDDQWVVLNPHASMGPVEFENVLKECNCTAKINLVAASTLLFACRAVEIGRVVVAGQKKLFNASAYPSSKNDAARELFKDVIPAFDFQGDVIRTSLDNINCWVHPAPTILNTGRIESHTPFEYYIDVTPAQGRCIDALDKERMAIAKAYDIEIRPLVEEYKVLYRTDGENMYEIFKNNLDLHGISGQKSLETRYLLEDVPNSLVANQTLARIAGVETPVMDSMIQLGRTLVPGMEEGRTIKNLGLEGVTKEEFIQMCR